MENPVLKTLISSVCPGGAWTFGCVQFLVNKTLQCYWCGPYTFWSHSSWFVCEEFCFISFRTSHAGATWPLGSLCSCPGPGLGPYSLLRGAELVSTCWRMVACSQVLIFFGLHFSALWWQYLQIAFLCLFFFLPIIALCCIFLSRLCVTFCLEAGGREWGLQTCKKGFKEMLLTSIRPAWVCVRITRRVSCGLGAGPTPWGPSAQSSPLTPFPRGADPAVLGPGFLSPSLCTVYFPYIF